MHRPPQCWTLVATGTLRRSQLCATQVSRGGIVAD
jgi:hypothetical protein